MTRITLGVLLLSLASCGDDGDSGEVSQLFATSRRIIETVCMCNPDEDCSVDEERAACARSVVLRHEDELSEWAACANDAYTQLEPCIERAACDSDAIERCFDEIQPMELCDDMLPEALDDGIDEEVDRECPRDIECSDGMMARGNYCNDITECNDGSDEQFCESDAQFTCLNGEMISESWVCDGFDDCGDNSDENPSQCMSGCVTC